MTTTPTPAAISGAISASNDLSDEGPLAQLLAYRSAKRRSGCPVDLENQVVEAARKCEEWRAALQNHLLAAQKEAAGALADLAADGTKFYQSWHVLDGRTTAEHLGSQLREARQRFNALLTAWAIVADRIQPSVQEGLAALRERWEGAGYMVMRRAFVAARPGVSPPKGRDALLEALVEGRIDRPEA